MVQKPIKTAKTNGNWRKGGEGLEYENILFEMKKEHVALITVNRPKALNALNDDVLKELNQAFDEIEADKNILGLIITGAGRSFVAGADLAQLRDYGPEENRANAGLAQDTFTRLENLPLPTIAAVNGFALGGGNELAMSCDIRIASEKAKFGQPEVSLGVPPCFGGTQRLPRLVGYGMAKEMIYTGRMVRAEEAKEIGLVNQVVAPEALISAAEEMMDQIIGKSPRGIRYSKLILNETVDMSLAEGLEFEKNISAICYGLPDKKEGFHAFLEKRDPVYEMRRPE